MLSCRKKVIGKTQDKMESRSKRVKLDCNHNQIQAGPVTRLTRLKLKEAHTPQEKANVPNVPALTPDPLGNGGFARVSIVTMEVNGVPTRLARKRFVNEEDFSLFRREVSILKKINHPNIVQLVSYDPSRKMLFLQMCGSNLAKVCGRVTWTTSVDIASQVACALGYLHSINIAHLDVKPENILMDPDIRHVRLCDFNSASRLDSRGVGTIRVFTKSLAPPENSDLETVKRKCKPSDVWSLGVTIVKLFMGCYPWKVANNEDSRYTDFAKCAASSQLLRRAKRLDMKFASKYGLFVFIFEKEKTHLYRHNQGYKQHFLFSNDYVFLPSPSDWILDILKINEEERPTIDVIRLNISSKRY